MTRTLALVLVVLTLSACGLEPVVCAGVRPMVCEGVTRCTSTGSSVEVEALPGLEPLCYDPRPHDHPSAPIPSSP